MESPTPEQEQEMLKREELLLKKELLKILSLDKINKIRDWANTMFPNDEDYQPRKHVFIAQLKIKYTKAKRKNDLRNSEDPVVESQASRIKALEKAKEENEKEEMCRLIGPAKIKEIQENALRKFPDNEIAKITYYEEQIKSKYLKAKKKLEIEKANEEEERIKAKQEEEELCRLLGPEKVKELQNLALRKFPNNEIAKITYYQEQIKSKCLKAKKKLEIEKAKEAEEKVKAKEEAERVKAKLEEESVKAKEEAERVKAKLKEERAKAKLEADRVKAKEEAERVKVKEEAERVKAKLEAERVKAKEEAERVKAKEEAERVNAKEETERVKAKEEADRLKAKLEAEELCRLLGPEKVKKLQDLAQKIFPTSEEERKHFFLKELGEKHAKAEKKKQKELAEKKEMA